MKRLGAVGFKVKLTNCLLPTTIYTGLNLTISIDFGTIDGLIASVEGSTCYCFIFKLHCFKILM